MGGLCGKSDGDDVTSITVTTVSGNLTELALAMRAASHGDWRLQLVTEMQTGVATSVGAQSQRNGDGTIGDDAALVVGVSCIGETTGYTFLASDSFNPCVPIVMQDDHHTWLAHSNGMSKANDIIKDKATYGDAVIYVIYVISKTLYASNKAAAEAIFKALSEAEFAVELVELAISGRSAVVVSGVGKCILVYRH